MAKEKRKIIVMRGCVKRLAERCGCNELTVRLALDGMANTELRKEVRRIALEEMGGVYSRL